MPPRVHALLIGVEAYDAGPIMDLPGCVPALVEFRNWLERAGASTEHVRLLASPVSANAALLGDAPIPPATWNNLLAELDRLEQSDAGMLMILWAGHGAVRDSKQRVLYLADSKQQRCTLGLDSLLARLRPLKHLQPQLIFVDACAVPFEQLDEAYQFPTRVIADERSIPVFAEQSVQFAAAKGQAAQVSTFPHFSRELLGVLQAGAFPPDFDAVASSVNARFVEQRKEGLPQTPVTYRYIGRAGDETEWGEKTTVNVAELRARYRAAFAAAFSRMEVPGVASLGGLGAPPLLEAFVPPQFAPRETPGTAGSSRPEAPWWARASSTTDLTKVLRESRRVVVLGDMGAGKSTVLKYVAMAFAHDVPSPLGLNEQRLPVYADLADYAAEYRDRKAETLADYLRRHASRMLALDDRAGGDFLTHDLKAGRLCLCLDGLDKVGTKAERKRVVGEIEALAKVSEDNRVLVSSRLTGYDEAPLQARGPGQRSASTHYTLLPPSPGAAAALLRKWCGDAGDVLWASLQATGRTPDSFLLTTIAAISHLLRGDRPVDDDTEALGRFINALLDDWEGDGEIRPEEREMEFFRSRLTVLASLAYSLQSEQSGSGVGVSTEEDDLHRRVAHALRNEAGLLEQEEVERQARRFVDRCRTRSGLIRASSGQASNREAVYEFWHPSLQEYLAARHVASVFGRDADRGWALLAPYLFDARWTNVIRLTLGCLHEDAQPAGDLLARIAAAPSPFEDVLHRSLFMAAYIAARVPSLSESDVLPTIEDLNHVLSARPDSPTSQPAFGFLVGLARYPATADTITQLAPDTDPQWLFDVAAALPPERALGLADRLDLVATTAEPFDQRVKACRLLDRIGRTGRARTILRELLKASPSGLDRFQQTEAIEVLASMEGGRRQALEILRKVLAAPEPSRWAPVSAAELFIKLGEPLEATRLLLRVPEGDWEAPEAAALLERLGKPAESLRLLRSSLGSPTRAWFVARDLIARAPDLRPQAIEALVSHASMPELDSSTRIANVGTLLDLTQSDPDQSVLLGLLARRPVARSCAEFLIPELIARGQAAAVATLLAGFLGRPDHDPGARTGFTFHRAHALLEQARGRSDPGIEREAAAALCAIAADGQAGLSRRTAAAELLVTYGLDSDAATAYAAIADDEGTFGRADALFKLIELGGDEAAVRARALAIVKAEGPLGAVSHSMAGRLLDAGYREAASAVIDEVLEVVSVNDVWVPDLFLPLTLDRLGRATEAQAFRDRLREEALAVLHGADDRSISNAAEWLYMTGQSDTATEALLALASREGVSADSRLEALSSVISYGGERRGEALGILADLVEDPQLDYETRRAFLVELEARA